MDIALLLALASVTTLVYGYVPYFRDILSKKTSPHIYTWFIWVITQTVVVIIGLYGGAGWGVLSLAIGAILLLCVFCLSFRYGTRNITIQDTVFLALALCAIVLWRFTKAPLPSLLMVTSIDAAGYLPTLRKCWHDPWSETLSFWLLCSLSNGMSLMALSQFNWLTATGLVTLMVLNLLVFTLCLCRRQCVAESGAWVRA